MVKMKINLIQKGVQFYCGNCAKKTGEVIKFSDETAEGEICTYYCKVCANSLYGKLGILLQAMGVETNSTEINTILKEGSDAINEMQRRIVAMKVRFRKINDFIENLDVTDNVKQKVIDKSKLPPTCCFKCAEREKCTDDMNCYKSGFCDDVYCCGDAMTCFKPEVDE